MRFSFFTVVILSWTGILFSDEKYQSQIVFEGSFSKSDSQSLETADQYYDAELYSKAIPYYKKLLSTLRISGDQKNVPYLRSRLAQSFFFSGDFKAVILLFQEIPEPSLLITDRYIRALSLTKLKNDEAAEEELQKVLSMPESLSFSEEALFELAMVYYRLGKVVDARAKLKSIQSEADSIRLRFLSGLYLVRLDLAAEDDLQAEKTLNMLASTIPGDLLKYEWYYLYGETFFQRDKFSQAAQYYEQALPINNPETVPWYTETLYRLGLCYLEGGSNPELRVDEQKISLEKAEKTWKQLLAFSPEERTWLALGQCYLTKARCLEDESAYQKAEEVLSKTDIILSREAQAHALLLRAEAAPTYEKRDLLYRHLTQESHRETPHYIKGWYLRGLNDFEEGQTLSDSARELESNQAFERAIASLKQAFELLKLTEPARAGLTVKYQAQAAFAQKTPEKTQEALNILSTLLKQYPDIVSAMENPDEIYYLHAQIAAHLNQWKVAEESIRDGLVKYPDGEFADSLMLLEGIISYNQQKYEQATAVFVKLESLYPTSGLAGESLFWAARCADALQLIEKGKDFRKRVFEQYPTSPYAAEAYFTYYGYQDYLQGDRAAIKHLQGLTEKFPNSSFLMNAWYLIGLDYKRDRKTPEGKWIRKRNLNEAIDAFQAVESTFDQIGKFPVEERSYFTTIRYRAMLERALANLAIAEESQGAKRQIYLEYAQELFGNILSDFKNKQHPLYQQLNQTEECGQIFEESAYWLAHAHIRNGDDLAAENVLAEMLEKYQSAKITRGYFLSRVLNERGQISIRRKEYQLALDYFLRSEDAAKGKILTADQRLELWIQQSFCHCAMHNYDNAILLLSRAVNDDSVSGLRIKAMYLRAELNELQGRHELARRQLEATSKKGGEWALKAKEKLEKEHGYK